MVTDVRKTPKSNKSPWILHSCHKVDITQAHMLRRWAGNLWDAWRLQQWKAIRAPDYHKIPGPMAQVRFTICCKSSYYKVQHLFCIIRCNTLPGENKRAVPHLILSTTQTPNFNPHPIFFFFILLWGIVHKIIWRIKSFKLFQSNAPTENGDADKPMLQ